MKMIYVISAYLVTGISLSILGIYVYVKYKGKNSKQVIINKH